MSDIDKSWSAFVDSLILERYSIKEKGKPVEKTYQDVINRVVGTLHKSASSELKPLLNHALSYAQQRYFIPATPILMNVGSPAKYKTYFSCFPLGSVPDSIEGIFQYASDMANIFRCGGGVGLDLSLIRESGAFVSNAQGVASGPLPFAQIYNTITECVSQAGRRRGATMLTINGDHKDAVALATAKSRGIKIEGCNISLYSNPNVSDEVLRSALECGDPGFIFIENVKKSSIINLEFEPWHVNPCAEYMSVPNTACNLLSINLALLAETSDSWSSFYSSIEATAQAATIFGNYILDYAEQTDGFPNEKIKNATMRLRPVGVGMTGLHEALIYFGVPYDESALEHIKNIQASILIGTLCGSSNYKAKTGKCPDLSMLNRETYNHMLTDLVDNYVGSMATSLYQEILSCLEGDFPFANIITTVQAPAGTVSQFAHSLSTGIEPIWDNPTVRRVRGKDGNFREITLRSRALQSCPEYDFKPATSISPEIQIKILCELQRYCHTAVSKTINLPKGTTLADIRKYFNLAYESGLKCVTFYVDKSKENQILSSAPPIEVSPKQEPKHDLSSQRKAVIYPVKGSSTTYLITSQNGNSEIYELFIESGKSGTAVKAYTEALGRVISIAIQHDPDLSKPIARTLAGIDDGSIYLLDGKRHCSIPDAVSSILVKPNAQTTTEASPDYNLICPECGKTTMRRNGNCKKCDSCGYSTC